MSPLRLAWQNLTLNPSRLAIAAGGVTFAVLQVFLQLGFYASVERAATILFDRLSFDLLIVSSEYQSVTKTRDIPRERLSSAQAVSGVSYVTPLAVGSGSWRTPLLPQSAMQSVRGLSQNPEPGSSSFIFVLGLPPSAIPRVFRIGRDGVFPDLPSAEAAQRELTRANTALFDRTSRPEFGTYELLRDPTTIDVSPRLNGSRVDLVGECAIGTGFGWKGLLVTSEETCNDLLFRSSRNVTIGLVALEPGTDLGTVQSQLQSALPPDVEVLTRAEVNRKETNFLLHGNPIGELLLAGLLLAIGVGALFLYQMMSADIRNQLPAYATAKALGYGPRYLIAVVLWQAVILAVIGYLPGLLASVVMYEWTKEAAGLPMQLEVHVAIIVFVLPVLMCVGSGWLAVQKVLRADPATLF